MNFTPLDNYLKQSFKNAKSEYGNLTSEVLPLFKEYMYDTITLQLLKNEERTHSNASVIPTIEGYLAAMIHYQTLLKHRKDPKKTYMAITHAGLLNKHIANMNKPYKRGGTRRRRRA